MEVRGLMVLNTMEESLFHIKVEASLIYIQLSSILYFMVVFSRSRIILNTCNEVWPDNWWEDDMLSLIAHTPIYSNYISIQ